MPETRTADRHAETPLSLRLGGDRDRVAAAAERAGVPVRAYIVGAVRERLEREESGAQTAEISHAVADLAPTWEALLAEALRQAPEEVRGFAAALAGALGQG